MVLRGGLDLMKEGGDFQTERKSELTGIESYSGDY